MEKVLKYIYENKIEELEPIVKHYNGKPRITINYTLKSNCKRKRKLKILTVEKDCEWYIISSILKISDDKYIKKIEIHEDEFDIVIPNMEYIIKLFLEVKEWFDGILKFHCEKLNNNLKVFNDLDFIYGNENISYRFSLNPGGLLVRVKILKYTEDSIELLKYISENCNAIGGTCIIENSNENRKSIFDKVDMPLKPKKKRIEISDEDMLKVRHV